jgi:hypothetical protein
MAYLYYSPLYAFNQDAAVAAADEESPEDDIVVTRKLAYSIVEPIDARVLAIEATLESLEAVLDKILGDE